MMNRREISTYSRSADNSVNANSIELQDKGEVSRIHITPEENRKVISREMKNLQYILSGDSKITKYSWESDGEKVSKIFWSGNIILILVNKLILFIILNYFNT